MRRSMLVGSALCALSVAACGTATRVDFRGHSRPSPPVDVSVYVDNQQVVVSPRRVGAGVITFDVANQGTRRLNVYVTPAGGNCLLPGTGPMAPGTTAQLTLNLRTEAYTVGPCTTRGAPGATSIRLAGLTVGAPRQAGDSALLQP